MGRKTIWHVMAAGVGLSLTLALTLGSTRAQMQPLGAEAALANIGTAFTYQGRLTSSGAPFNGTCDFQFSLWDAASGGTQIGSTQTKTNVGVSAGYFTIADLDFGASAFNGEARWLAIAVRCPTGSGSYTALSPRLALTATPYAHSLRPGAVISGSVTNGIALFVRNTATSGFPTGIYGRSDSSVGYGLFGLASAASGVNYGVYGRSDSASGRGVFGLVIATTGSNYGVYGRSESGNGTGVFGWADGYGVYGKTDSASGYAGYFQSPNLSGTVAVYARGNIQATGLIAGMAKAFVMDHPTDPANKYLYHFAQEGPAVQNVYNGVVTLDAAGEATVTLPDYFAAANAGPFLYQLTAIGAAMPNLHIAAEISGNVFTIAGGVPGRRVSWEVTATRSDPTTRSLNLAAEVDKPADERGAYLHPQAFGQPPEKGLDYQRNAALQHTPPESPATGGDR